MGRQQEDGTGFSLSPSVVVEYHSTTDEGHENDSRKRLDVIREEVIMAFLLKIQSTLGHPRLQQDQQIIIRWRSYQGSPRFYMLHTYCVKQNDIKRPYLVCMGSDKNSSSLAGLLHDVTKKYPALSLGKTHSIPCAQYEV